MADDPQVGPYPLRDKAVMITVTQLVERAACFSPTSQGMETFLVLIKEPLSVLEDLGEEKGVEGKGADVRNIQPSSRKYQGRKGF